MLQVSTIDYYNEVGSKVAADLAERYFLVEPARAVGDGLAMTRVSCLRFSHALLREFYRCCETMDSEAARRRMGFSIFVHCFTFIGALIVIAIGLKGHCGLRDG